MNQKKKTEKNTEKIKEAVVSLFILIVVVLFTGQITYYMHKSTAEMMRVTISLVMGCLIILFLWYQSVMNHTLEYDNERYQIRFFLLFFVCYLFCVGMIYLPVASWTFLPVMVTLSMFSNPFIGLVSGSILLMTTVSLSPDATMYIFFLYFLLGLIGISLFQKLDVDFRVGEPLFLSALCSLCLQTAYLVIFENQPLAPEILILPILNLFINMVILFLILKYFSKLAMYSLQDKYAQINDPEFPLLAELKQQDKEMYFEAVHRAYLGDRISKRLHINNSAVKGCAYYYKLALAGEKKEENSVLFQELHNFPEELKKLMKECMSGKYGSRESCVVLTCEQVICRVIQAQKEYVDRDVPYENIITEIFDSMIEDGRLSDCDISIKELGTMKTVCIEEKLYYDFLR